MTRCLSQPEKLIRLSLLCLALAAVNQGFAQQAEPQAIDESTVVYEADFFTQYSPVSVNDLSLIHI